MKSTKEARTMSIIIKDETDNLPEYNLFGESNREARLESLKWVEALNYYVITSILPDEEECLEVYNWITEREWSPLDDYSD